jgi:hypothetical protein
MANRRHSDEQLEDQYGRRGSGTALFSPQELGYRCPKGHGDIEWSEFKKHIWCYVCQQDFHYADHCFLVEDFSNPKFEDNEPKPPILKGHDNWDEDGMEVVNIPEDVAKKLREGDP